MIYKSNLDMEISGTAAAYTKPAASQRFQVGLPLTSLNPPWFHIPHSIGNDQTPRMNMLNTTQRRMKLGSFLIRTRVEIWLVNFVSLRNLFARRFTLTNPSQSHANSQFSQHILRFAGMPKSFATPFQEAGDVQKYVRARWERRDDIRSKPSGTHPIW